MEQTVPKIVKGLTVQSLRQLLRIPSGHIKAEEFGHEVYLHF